MSSRVSFVLELVSIAFILVLLAEDSVAWPPRDCWSACQLSTRGQSHIRGLVTAGRCFGRSVTAGLMTSVAPTMMVSLSSGLLIASSRVTPRAASSSLVVVKDSLVSAHVSITARDQHQPASSRAIAALAVFEFFFRSMNPTHRWCSLWLPSSPLARTGADARSSRERSVFDMRYLRRWCQAASADMWVHLSRGKTIFCRIGSPSFPGS